MTTPPEDAAREAKANVARFLDHQRRQYAEMTTEALREITKLRWWEIYKARKIARKVLGIGVVLVAILFLGADAKPSRKGYLVRVYSASGVPLIREYVRGPVDYTATTISYRNDSGLVRIAGNVSFVIQETEIEKIEKDE